MNITTLALTFKIDPAEWANEYGIPVAEAADNIRAAFDCQYSHIAETLTKQWPMMRDSATVTVSAPGKALETLIDNGLTFAECVKVFAARQDAADVITAARDQYQNEGSVEIDDNAIVSDSDEGAYVMAWVWVPNDSDAHEEGDGCASYDTGYQLIRRSDGFQVDAEDLEPGDEYRDPASDGTNDWYTVTDVQILSDGQTVHVESDDDTESNT